MIMTDNDPDKNIEMCKKFTGYNKVMTISKLDKSSYTCF